jgi:uncharacterized protein YcbK (DUF882 family)
MTPEQKFDKFFTGKSQYFTPAEIGFMGGGNSTGKGKGKNELPPENLWPNILPTLEMADWLRGFYDAPLKVLSAYRSPAYNAAIGGAKGSLHMQFKAMDLAPASADPAAIKRLKGCAEILVKRGVLKGGVGRYSWGIHIDCGPRRDW